MDQKGVQAGLEGTRVLHAMKAGFEFIGLGVFREGGKALGGFAQGNRGSGRSGGDGQAEGKDPEPAEGQAKAGGHGGVVLFGVLGSLFVVLRSWLFAGAPPPVHEVITTGNHRALVGR